MHFSGIPSKTGSPPSTFSCQPDWPQHFACGGNCLCNIFHYHNFFIIFHLFHHKYIIYLFIFILFGTEYVKKNEIFDL